MMIPCSRNREKHSKKVKSKYKHIFVDEFVYSGDNNHF